MRSDPSNKSTLVVDVSPLWELEYTGISNVVLELSRRFASLESPHYDVLFSVFHKIVPADTIMTSMSSREGSAIRHAFEDSVSLPTIQSWKRDQTTPTAGLHLHIKPRERVFDFEAQLYYDLSYLSVPECHTVETVDYHARDIVDQVNTTNSFFSISMATARDLNFYFGVDFDKIEVAHLGAHVDFLTESRVRKVLDERTVEPFFLCLGTIEPRKNIRLVLAWLKQNIDTLRRYRFVFVGRIGWGGSFRDILAEYNLEPFYDNGQITHLGYVSESQKSALMCSANGLLYPSLFEGFGLPVLEAMALGTPVASSCSTSLPEVLGPDGIYFDPYSVRSFGKAMTTLIYEDITGSYKIRCEQLRQRASEFNYDKCFDVIRTSLENNFLLECREVRDGPTRSPEPGNRRRSKVVQRSH